MKKLLSIIIASLMFLSSSTLASSQSEVQNGCVSFTVGQGTGCDWMCNYCSTQLSTNNYYFTDGVCTYQTGGCVGNPISGKQYTCCAVNEKKEL